MNTAYITFETDSDVARTLLIPLYARAQEAKRPDALLRDERAVEMIERIDYDFSRLHLPPFEQASIILRLRQFDRWTCDFLARHPDAVVVHIGCGLDTRFERLDNGRVEWYDLDLPEVIALRRELLPEHGRARSVAASVFDPAWTEIIGPPAGRPFLFVAEAVLPYFEEAEVKSLVLMLRERYPGCELITDEIAPVLQPFDNRMLRRWGVKARLHWAPADGRAIEAWAPGIELLQEWYYTDRPEPRLGPSQWVRYIPSLARGVGIFRYRLGPARGAS